MYSLGDRAFGLPEICLGQRSVPEAGDDRLNCAFHISYSCEANCETLQSLHTDFYLKEIVGSRTWTKGGLGFGYNRIGLIGEAGKTLSFIVFKDKQ